MCRWSEAFHVKPDIVERMLDCRGAFLQRVGKAPGVITMSPDDYAAMKNVKDPQDHGIFRPAMPGRRWFALGMFVFVGHHDCKMVAASPSFVGRGYKAG